MEEEEYFRMIEDYFVQKRGNPMLLSPKEWALIREWHEAGIPGEVVLRAIDRGFEKKKEEFESPVTLTYFRRIVKSEYKRFLKSQEGLSIEKQQESSTNVLEFLEKLLHSLEESSTQAGRAGNQAMADLLQGCREKLSTDVVKPFHENQNMDLQRVEHQLATLEKEIEKVLLQTISESQLNSFRENAMRDLKTFQEKIDFPVYQEMINRALIKSVRKLYNIPRLSLFYM
ncbi:hypothetical protein L0222_27980 [bacterium]|nr:hypothetical protein [bacterium]MCI0604073.1 hypothetical protein [bacterium]